MKKIVVKAILISSILTIGLVGLHCYDNIFRRWRMRYGNVTIHGFGIKDEVRCDKITVMWNEKDWVYDFHLKLGDSVISLKNATPEIFNQLTPIWDEMPIHDKNHRHSATLKNATLSYFTSRSGKVKSMVIDFSNSASVEGAEMELYASNNDRLWIKFPASMDEVYEKFGKPREVTRLPSD